jgi:hypothetical protein
MPRVRAAPETFQLDSSKARRMAMIAPPALHLFRHRLIAIGVVLGLVEIVVGTVAGAWLYKEREVPSGAPASAVGR